MTDEELSAFLTRYGLGDTQYSQNFEFIRSLITTIENDPLVEFPYSDLALHNFAYSLKASVNEYYDVDLSNVPAFYASDGLTDSTVYSAEGNLGAYNCYSYALGKTDVWSSPGQYSDSEHSSDAWKGKTIKKVAQLVEADLKEWNVCSASITDIQPAESVFNSGKNIMCVRLGWTNGNVEDFHFMKYFGSKEWRHKPGASAILKYDYTPTTGRAWPAEGFYKIDYILWQAFEARRIPSLSYSRPIYYIVWGHDYTKQYVGNGSHSGSFHVYEYHMKCTKCGAVLSTGTEKVPCSGPPCVAP